MVSKHPLHRFIFLLFLHVWSSAKDTINNGFSIEVIHRDSPLSPFYNTSTTPFHRFMEAAQRSLARSRSYRSSFASTSSIQSTVYPDIADHLMKFSIGTPPVQVLVVMDTGSDLVWSRCKPCVDCIGRSVPLFDPQQSSTYIELSCDSPQCKALDASACDKRPKCKYTYGYGDGSSTSGVLSTETLTFDTTDGGTFSIHDVAFGCGHNNSISFSDHLYGLAGLGRQSYSLISQLGPYIGGKFSYCFVPFQENTSTSIMSFGDQAVFTGNDVVSTPLLGEDSGTFYYVLLEHISVGGMMLEVPPPKASGIGNMFIDSGTTVTLIDSKIFQQLKQALNGVVKLPPTTDPGKTFLCYNATSRDGFPTITFHFAGNADLVLQPLNAFTEPSPDGLVCLVMLPTDGMPIFGNTVQHNFHVSYDLVGKKVSFKPTQCSNVSN
ncbi:Peptidase A1 [Cocos nucifera]|uniref:Peptidase A1 n=1 Tax=Cocos nucifera TaxID=13894 RepID=A0A8K0I682_COCNU|nr:Peptidase A1 [Cocos nucifera]